MSIRVKKVSYFQDYKLKIIFSDGKVKIVDFENWIKDGGFYLDPLKDMNFFKQVSLDDLKYTICWPNGADFCPDVLYAEGNEIRKSSEARKRTSKRVKTSLKTRKSKKMTAK